MLWATVPLVQATVPLVSLRETAAGLVAVSCGDRCKYSVSVYSSVRADVLCY